MIDDGEQLTVRWIVLAAIFLGTFMSLFFPSCWILAVVHMSVLWILGGLALFITLEKNKEFAHYFKSVMHFAYSERIWSRGRKVMHMLLLKLPFLFLSFWSSVKTKLLFSRKTNASRRSSLLKAEDWGAAVWIWCGQLRKVEGKRYWKLAKEHELP